MSENRYDEAVEWARPWLRTWVQKLDRPGMSPSEQAPVLLQMSLTDDIFERLIDDLFARLGADQKYRIRPRPAIIEREIKPRGNDPWAFETLLQVAGECVRTDRKMPAALQAFAADYLVDKIQRPVRRKGRPETVRKRNFMLGWMVYKVAKDFDLPEYSTEWPEAKTAVLAVIEAMRLEGHDFKYATVLKARQSLTI